MELCQPSRLLEAGLRKLSAPTADLKDGQSEVQVPRTTLGQGHRHPGVLCGGSLQSQREQSQTPSPGKDLRPEVPARPLQPLPPGRRGRRTGETTPGPLNLEHPG